MTDSAISGPIPSPGKRVARIVVAEEEKALAATKAVLGFEWLPRARRRRWEAMIEILISERERERFAKCSRERVDYKVGYNNL